MRVRYVLIPKFIELTCYTEKAMRMKIESGVWLQGRKYRKAPDGHVVIDLDGYERWVDGQVGSPR